MTGADEGRGRWTHGAMALAVLAVLANPAAAAAACPTMGSETAQVVAVDPRLEVRLNDGRRLRLVGLDPVLGTPDEPDRDERARADFASLLAGRSISIQTLSVDPDRWGRLPALAFVGAEEPGGLSTAAIAAGWGRYLPEPAASECRAALVAAEERARAAKLGLWADPYYAVLGVDDGAGFTERAGTLVTAEGRLASVTASPYRTKLVFRSEVSGSRGGQLLSATILPRVVKGFEARGMRVATLVGRRLRVRGLLDLRFGPQIELAGPDSLDVLDPAASAGGVDAQVK